MSRFTFITITVVLAMGAAHAQQQTEPQPSWIADQSGCRVWNLNPQPNESMTWDGQCENGIATGKGIVRYFENGIPDNTYEGDYKDGRLNGHGVAVYVFGSVYEGEWKNSKRDGRGIMTYANGDRYDGEWKDGKRNGHGVLVRHLDGNRFDGEWKDDDLFVGSIPFDLSDRLYRRITDRMRREMKTGGNSCEQAQPLYDALKEGDLNKIKSIFAQNGWRWVHVDVTLRLWTFPPYGQVTVYLLAEKSEGERVPVCYPSFGFDPRSLTAEITAKAMVKELDENGFIGGGMQLETNGKTIEPLKYGYTENNAVVGVGGNINRILGNNNKTLVILSDGDAHRLGPTLGAVLDSALTH